MFSSNTKEGCLTREDFLEEATLSQILKNSLDKEGDRVFQTRDVHM